MAWEVAEDYVPKSLYAQILALLVGFPVLTILINVAQQLLLPHDPKLPPEVFHLVPFFGSAASFGNDPLAFFDSCRRKYGDCFTFVLLGRKMTVCVGPKGSNLVLGGKLSEVSAEEAYTHLTTPVFGQGVVFDCPNHRFMEQKRFIKFGLSQENLQAYVGMISEEVANFLNYDAQFTAFREKDATSWSPFHVLRTTSEMTILTASRTLQGKEVRSHIDSQTFSRRYADLDGGFKPINVMFPDLPLPSYRRRDRAQKAMSDFYVGILRNRQAEKGEQEHDMIASLMGQAYKDGTPLSERDIAHMLIALLMAGQHTSSATSSWILLRVAENPEVGERLYNEQVEHFRNADGSWRPLTYDELKKLPVLDSVIRETLRLHPPIHSIFRKVMSDIAVPPTLFAPSEDKTYIIPKGHFVMASPAASQIDPLIWTDPLKWNPARWADAAGAAAKYYSTYYDAGEKVDFGFGVVSKGTESPYQPFGAGRHRCIGEQFAYLQIGTILATLVRNIEMKLTHPFPEPNYHTMVTLPKEPCNIMYRRRSEA
ncbi:cytochrome P450 [Exidia glandulosa HHB12029]|uniref:Cytochrome P450 n=1 Tax=Exidia glandulosa HHB12029 TaxID=1314781 RepID=A0A165BI27_EXIGL|nr:cytochrome P450 [Exidia glandulosa HHB12029]